MRILKRVTIVLVVVVAVLVTVGFLTTKRFRAPSNSMEPNVHAGERFLVWRLFGYSPHVGDIVVFRPPVGANEGRCPAPHPRQAMCVAAADDLDDVNFIKRIVAGPGDRVSMRAGRVTRDGRPESGYRLAPCDAGERCDFPVEAVVPAGHWLVLGDNRGISDDSRFWGTVPAKAFVGRKLLTYWG